MGNQLSPATKSIDDPVLTGELPDDDVHIDGDESPRLVDAKRAMYNLAAPSTLQGAHGFTMSHANFVNASGSVTQHIHVYGSSKSTLDLVQANSFRAIQMDTFKKRTPETGNWFLRSPKFQKWVNSSGGILWVTGMPGAGKTVLSSLVIYYLEDIAKESPDVTVAFVYCRYSESMSVEDILVALIRQHLERHPFLAEIINPVFARHKHENTTPSQHELLKLLNELSTHFKAVFYSLDALDESPPDAQFDLVDTISSINAHFFITSRPLDLLKKSFPTAIFFEVEAQEADIRLFIEYTIARNPAFHDLLTRNGHREEVITKIIEKSHGMFLHASLQVEALRHCYSLTDLRQTMSDFPVKIQDMYVETMKRVLGQLPKNAELAKLILEFLVSLCCGLFTVDKETQLVRLVHYTAKEVLQPLLSPFYPHPHSIIAEACIVRLISCDFHVSKLQFVGDLERAFKHNPLLLYASDHWGLHALRCHDLPAVQSRAANFVQACSSFPFVYRFRTTKHKHGLDKLGPLHVAALYDFPEVLEHLLSTKVGTLQGLEQWGVATPTEENGLTPLMLAAYNGHEHPLRKLLGVPGINVNQGKWGGRTALMVAAYRNHPGIVRCLLDVPDVLVNLPAEDGWTALIVASHKGHDAIIRLLLGVADIRVNDAQADGWTPMMLATGKGHEGAVRLLLSDPNIDVNLRSVDGWSALMLAARHGHEGIVQHLLSVPEVDPNLTKVNGWSALMFAAKHGHESIVQQLLDSPGILVNLPDKNGRTAFMVASQNGREGVVRRFLALPAIDVNLGMGESGWRPLMLAASGGHEGTVQLLLQVADIQVNQGRTFDGWSALMLAARHGYEGIVKMLLAVPGVDVNVTKINGWSALMFASKHGHGSIVRQLLEVPDIDANLADEEGLTALMTASEHGHENIVKQLLDHREIQLGLTDKKEKTALMWAKENGQEGVVNRLSQLPVQLLLQSNAGSAEKDQPKQKNRRPLFRRYR